MPVRARQYGVGRKIHIIPTGIRAEGEGMELRPPTRYERLCDWVGAFKDNNMKPPGRMRVLTCNP